MSIKSLILAVTLLAPMSSYASDFTVSSEMRPYIGNQTRHYIVSYSGPNQYEELSCQGAGIMSISGTPTQNVFIYGGAGSPMITCYSSPKSTQHTPGNVIFTFSLSQAEAKE